jgi:hypothetical protein
MLSEDELNAPAVVRASGKPLGVNRGAPDREKRFATLREALDWIEGELKTDPALLVFGMYHAHTGEPLMDRDAYQAEMRSRRCGPV